MSPPLEGVHVVDLTRGVAGPYATKLLADYGADVLKLEPPGGDPARSFGPFPGDAVHPERSGLFLHLNTNKQSAIADPTNAEGAALVRRLAASADVVVEDYAPGQAAGWGWGWDALRAVNDKLVLASITPFGQTGPYRDYRGSEITLQAMGGPMHATGNREREPLKLAGHFAHYHAGATAAYAILLALRRAELGGGGDWIDLAVYECQAGSRDRRTIHLTAAAYAGYAPQRAKTGLRRMAFGVRPCQDGFINIVGSGTRLPRLLKLIGREDLLDHPEVDAPMLASPPGLMEEVEASLAEWLAGKPKLEAVALAQRAGLLAGALMTIADLARDPQLQQRAYWERVDHPETGPLLYSGRPFRLTASTSPPVRRAPLLGEQQEAAAILPEPKSGAVGGSDPAPLPLDGIRVAAITLVWAGPHVGQLLAEWGAEVIRVEPVNRIQPLTRGAENVTSRERMLALAAEGVPPQYPNADPGDDPWNRFASFNSHARNKKSMACDVMSAEGREAFFRLIQQCDVLVENNVPQTIDKAGIGWEVLREINPRLIMLRMPAFGLEGPYRDYRAFGLHVEAMVGHTHLRAYTDGSPEGIGETLASDALSGVHGCVAVLMALRDRERTGRGQLIEMPLTESFVPTLGEYLMDWHMNGRDTPAQANQHRWHAPHGAYPCAGADNWIAIDVATDAEFSALCGQLDAPDLATDPRFALAVDRLGNRDALDAALGARTADRDKEVLFRSLQAVGVCAAPLHDPLEALADEQLNARGFFQELTIPGVGTHRYPGLTFRMARTPNRLRTPPPRLGEHNAEIYLDLLGYSRDELAELERKGLVGTRYPSDILPKR